MTKSCFTGSAVLAKLVEPSIRDSLIKGLNLTAGTKREKLAAEVAELVEHLIRILRSRVQIPLLLLGRGNWLKQFASQGSRVGRTIHKGS